MRKQNPNIYLITNIYNIYNNSYNREYLDLGKTDMPEEGIIEYVNKVFGFKDYDLYYSYLDFDHFVEIEKAKELNLFI